MKQITSILPVFPGISRRARAKSAAVSGTQMLTSDHDVARAAAITIDSQRTGLQRLLGQEDDEDEDAWSDIDVGAPQTQGSGARVKNDPESIKKTKDKAEKFLTQLHSAATVLERTLASLEGSSAERRAFMLEKLGNASEIIDEAYKRYKRMTMPNHNWEYEDLAEVRKLSSGDAKAVNRIMAICRI